MAASLVKSFANAKNALGLTLRTGAVCQTWTRTAFFRRKNDAAETLEDELEVPAVASITSHSLRKREGLQTVRGYAPPGDVEARVQKVVCDMCGKVADWSNVKLDNNRVKFKVLDKMMLEFDHYIPNSDLVNMQTVSDVVTFFSTPVRDTSSFEDLSKLDLPPNLHIQLDPLRFDPETDSMFGGVTAFPGRPTVVTSLKYRRKYGKNEK